MSAVYLDTHIAVALHGGLIERLTDEAKRRIEVGELLISPMVFLEFDFLFRRKRIAFDARKMLASLTADFGIELCRIPFAEVTLEALEISWTSDPFDRMIVAQASVNRASPLITRDRSIRLHYANAVW